MKSYRTNSLFHYTKRLDDIISILTSGKLIPNYCSEDLSTKANPNYIIGIPQICFCDIPLSQVKEHIDVYGAYGIGVTKNFARDNKITPVAFKSRISSNE